MGMDPFDEFEFKPLTDGLGFHQKKQQAATTVTPNRTLDFVEDLTDSPLRPPLPRQARKTPAAETKAPAPSPVDDILKTLHQNRKLEIELDRKHRTELRQPKTETWKTAAPSLAAAVLDGMLILAAGLLCMIVMLMVTKVDLIRNLSNPDTEGLVYLSTAALFVGVTFIYMLLNRVFLGFTPGEWAYDLRVGTPADQTHGLYVIQILFRQVLVTVTGFVVLPALGAIMGRDLTGRLTGAPLMKRN